MEAIASGNNKKRYLASKIDEIKSLKRSFEHEINEIEASNSLNSPYNINQIPAESVENAKLLLKETDYFLQQNDTYFSANEDSQLIANGLFGDELRKEKAGELFQYGFEVKYLPLARYLQTASKYISTENWCAAREEFRLARVFDRYLELRAAKATTLLQIPRQKYPPRVKTQHDAMLEEISWMSTDFHCEREWKIKMARQLAIEAREFVLKKLCVWSNTKAVAKVVPLSIHFEPFYRIKSEETFSQLVPIKKIDFEENVAEVPIDRDELVHLCDIGEKINNSTIGDLITTAEYQLGTSASFPNIIWYEHEDALLLELADRYKRNWSLISSTLNTQIYGGKMIRGPRGCQERHEELEKKSVTPKPQLTRPNPPLIHPNLLEKHNVKLGLMRGTSTKIITPRSIVPKKISFNVHPSHEAAARKANQNISKLLTPSELAQKRLQRTRLVNDTGTLNVPSIPRSTPSPNPSAANGSTVPQPQLQQHLQPSTQVPLPSSIGSAPNLPPMPQAVPSGSIYPQIPTASGHVNAAAAVQQIAAGMMRSGMIRPPSQPQNPSQQQLQTPKGQPAPPANPMIAQLQQLQQLQQAQQQMQMQQAAAQFTDSASQSSQSYRPHQQQVRPPAMNFMNLPPGITPLQLQQLQQQKQAQAQANQLQQQQQAAQLQQMYAKTMQSRPPNPSSANQQKASESNSDQSNANNSNVRTSPRKSSNK